MPGDPLPYKTIPFYRVDTSCSGRFPGEENRRLTICEGDARHIVVHSEYESDRHLRMRSVRRSKDFPGPIEFVGAN